MSQNFLPQHCDSNIGLFTIAPCIYSYYSRFSLFYFCYQFFASFLCFIFVISSLLLFFIPPAIGITLPTIEIAIIHALIRGNNYLLLPFRGKNSNNYMGSSNKKMPLTNVQKRYKMKH